MFSAGGHSPFQRTNIAIFLHNAKETHTFLLTAAIFFDAGNRCHRNKSKHHTTAP